MNNTHCTTDIFEKPIEIEDLDKTIKQTELFVGFSKSTKIEFKHQTKVGELKATGTQYYNDLLNKLNIIKENENTSN
jgi:hypothetical protein